MRACHARTGRDAVFVLTRRLVLRPAWAEEAAALQAAIAHEAVAMKLARLPWPYTLDDARWWLDQPRGETEPRFQIYDRTDGHRLIGGIGIELDSPFGGPELGYWLTPDAWGRGYCTEAGAALLSTARDTLRLERLVSGHWVKNPASGRVLVKLGFVPTGETEKRHCMAQGREVDCATYTLDLRQEQGLAA